MVEYNSGTIITRRFAMEDKEIITVLWLFWFAVLMLYPLFKMKPEPRFYGEGKQDQDEEV